MADAVVVGGGPGAVSVAGALRRSGRRVVLAQSGPLPGQVRHPEIPLGLGLERFSGPPAGWRPVAALTEGLLAGSAPERASLHALPLSRAALPALFPATAVPVATAAWMRSRASVELAKLLGGGKETRTYRDWVVQHFGEPVYDRLHRRYCARRFGEGAEVTVNVARLAHAPASGVWCSRVAGTAASMAADLEGVEVVVGAEIVGLATGRVSTTQGDIEGDVFVDAPPSQVVSWLGSAAPAGLANEVGRLRTRHALEVTVSGGSTLPAITHVIDAPMPFYRLVRHGLLPGNGHLAGTVSVQFSVEPDDALWASPDARLVGEVVAALLAVGVNDADGAGARIQRAADHHPVWVYTQHARMRRFALSLGELKITPVGRSGLHSPVDGGAEAAFLADLAAGSVSVRELFRRHIDPPVVDDDGNASLADFVTG